MGWGGVISAAPRDHVYRGGGEGWGLGAGWSHKRRATQCEGKDFADSRCGFLCPCTLSQKVLVLQPHIHRIVRLQVLEGFVGPTMACFNRKRTGADQRIDMIGSKCLLPTIQLRMGTCSWYSFGFSSFGW